MSKGHIHFTYTLAVCGHKVTCGCSHPIGENAWCISCQNFREVTEMTVWIEPNTMINALAEHRRRAELA